MFLSICYLLLIIQFNIYDLGCIQLNGFKHNKKWNSFIWLPDEIWTSTTSRGRVDPFVMEYTDCTSVEGNTPPPTSVLDMTLNNLIERPPVMLEL